MVYKHAISTVVPSEVIKVPDLKLDAQDDGAVHYKSSRDNQSDFNFD